MVNHPSKYGSSHARLTNCTFISNTSQRSETGGFVNQKRCSSILTNCILWENTARRDDNDVESAQIRVGKIVVNNCCIQGWSGNLGGIRNFGSDPLFVDPNGPDDKIGTLDDNLRLSLGSPCRDVGDNSALPADTADLDKDGDPNEPIPFDIEGKPRILNRVVDLGAYEGG